MSDRIPRRRFVKATASLGIAGLIAGCTGDNATTVQEEEVVVDGDINVSKIELDIQTKENNGSGTSESSITIYPEDNVVCYGEGDGNKAHTGCVRSKELTEKYLAIYQREKEESA